MTKVMVVKYRGAELYGYELGGIIYVALKPIVEGMGLEWSAQLKRVKRDAILSEGMAMMAIRHGHGSQNVCLRLDLVHGWLFRIDASRVRPAIRDQVLAYQRECYDVLCEHFSGGDTESVRHSNETTSLHIRMVNECRQIFGLRAAAELWKHLGLPLVQSMADAFAQLELALDYPPAKRAIGGP